MSRFLLDTHAFIWWVSDSIELSAEVREIIASPKHEIFFSAASAWEIAIKARLGRLKVVGNPETSVPNNIAKNNFVALPITVEAALRTHALERHHDDPFDRLLVAQSLTEDMPLISKDKVFKKYKITTLW
jgi:PIN domain nuclease of toxin-antitoxin system